MKLFLFQFLSSKIERNLHVKEGLSDLPGPADKWSLVSHMVSVRPAVHTSVRLYVRPSENKNTRQRYMGPGGSLTPQDLLEKTFSNLSNYQ